ncbi:M16 family metallopeptidase [Sphingomonas sp. URHD0057]|uniref:M16 family metallopeptidase n=1 Tax=Sphingomonas sp. URHD0057 TaxID=1380389 RepID=UPI00048F56B3|nr:pitrilysin family protein [Sphingomonas sp. URHD0057]
MMKLTTLDNGLRVVSRDMPGLETASVGVFARCGARDEPAHLNGLAHIFEHMVFKGAGGRSARELNEAIEDVGGELNAATERDGTSFTAAVMAEHVPLAVELIADLLLRPHFSADDLEREKEVVLQELAEVGDTPSDLIFDELWAASFGDQPLGRSILGEEGSIRRVTPADLHDWREQQYRGQDLILAAAGKVSHDALVEVAERHFSELPTGQAEIGERANFTGGVRIGRVASEQAHLTFGFEGPAERADDYFAARLFADVIGGGASSRLFHEVREERGLAYSVGASLHPFSDVGLFYVHASTSPREAAATSHLIGEILRDSVETIAEREVERVRTRAAAGLLMHLETPWGQASYAARQLAVYGRLVEPAEVLVQLAKVTLQEVCSAGGRMLGGPRATATIGVPAVRAA